MLTLTRIRESDNKRYVTHPKNIREAKQSIAWCMTDNANLSKHEASQIPENLELNKTLTAHGYTFLLEKDNTKDHPFYKDW